MSLCDKMSLFEYLFELGDGRVDLSGGDDVGGQEAQNGVVGAVHEDTLGHGVEHHLFAGNIELHADHESLPANLFDETELRLQFLEPRAEIRPDTTNGGQQLVEDVQEFKRHVASQRSAPKRGSMHAAADGGGCPVVCHDDSERDAAGERFGGDHDVGHDDGFTNLIREVRSGSAHTALDLVENHESVITVGDLPDLACILDGHRINAALALNPLHDNARGAFVHNLFQGCGVVLGNEFHAG